ncbi:MAG: LacI family transcriptional regulator [Lachnospiraceae bacterium]|nr:LacI family transcriptional regulator [Lachnospiraceae bacterium]
MKKYTIADVARELGVSRATVSRAMNGKPGVGKKLREEILKYIAVVDYKPNNLAKALSGGKTNFIGLILGDIRNPFYSELAFHVQRKLNSEGYVVIILNSEFDEKRELSYVQMAIRLNFAGVILLTAQNGGLEEMLTEENIAVVLINRFWPGFTGSSVISDNFKAGYIATMHLLELGHTNIGFISGHANSLASHNRHIGYVQAMNNLGLKTDHLYHQSSDLKMETGYQIGQKFMALPKKERPSAIVIINDMTALGFMSAIKEQGGCIPEDLSIVSFDDISIASVQGIDLTTVSHDTTNMSLKAANLIKESIENPAHKIEQIIINPKLKIRKTTRPYHSK